MVRAETQVTVVMTPRERFAMARRSLDSIIEHTKIPYRLVFVAGGARDQENSDFAALCDEHGFTFVSRPHFLPPNAARNIGLELVETPYVVFIDNDVIVHPGWLDALIGCAEETDADLVSPVVMAHTDFGDEFHSFGGTLKLETAGPRIRISERHHRQPAGSAGAEQRRLSDYAEFHCVLLKRAALERLGPFDENILNAAEHIDVALNFCVEGLTGASEPNAVVTYFPTNYTVGDFANYDQRWDTGWYGQTMDYLAEKWNLETNSSFFADYASSLSALRERCFLPQAWSRDRWPPRRIDPNEVPQTIVALLDRMSANGYTAHDLTKVRDAYLVTTDVFANAFRASGKTFLSHAAGVGGILCLFGASATVIAAGLLHASYQNGCFPKDVSDDIGAMRRWLRRRTSGSVELLVYLYSTLSLDDVSAYVSGDIDAMPLPLANAIIIRAADGVENRVLGDHRYFDSARWLADSNALASAWMPAFSAVAERLNCNGLAGALAFAIQDSVPLDGPSDLRPARPLNYTIDIETRAITPLPARHVAAMGGAEVFAPLQTSAFVNRFSIELDHVAALNTGSVSREDIGLRIVSSGDPWSYCAGISLNQLNLAGPGVVEVSVAAERGEVGILLLEAGSTAVQLGREIAVSEGMGMRDAQFAVSELKELGHLVFRRWPCTQPKSSIIVLSITIVTP